MESLNNLIHKPQGVFKLKDKGNRKAVLVTFEEYNRDLLEGVHIQKLQGENNKISITVLLRKELNES